MIIEHCEQRSPEWFALKCGVPSASGFGNIITPGGKPSAQATKYMYQLAAETVTGVNEPSYQSAAMARGIDLEDQARDAYEFIFDFDVEQVGLCFKDELRNVSCSPDGLMPALKRGLEIKCPLPATQIEYLIDGKVPNVYVPQVQGSLYVTGYETWHFMSFCPGMKPLFVLVERDEEYIKTIDGLLANFNKELRSLIGRIR